MHLEIDISNRALRRLLLVGLVTAAAGAAFAGQFTGIPFEPESGRPVSAQQMNGNFGAIADYVSSLDERLSLLESPHTRAIVSALRDSSQTIASGEAVVGWNFEVIDTTNSFGSNTFQAPRSGNYEICAHVNWFAAEIWPTGTDWWVDAQVTSTSTYTVRLALRRQQWGDPEVTRLGFVGGCRVQPLELGDKVRIIAGQNTTGSRTINEDSNVSIVEL